MEQNRRRIVSVSVQPGSTFVAGNPQLAVDLVSSNLANGALGLTFDIAPDGQRFLVIRQLLRTEDGALAPQLKVVLNWGEELKRLAPAKK